MVAMLIGCGLRVPYLVPETQLLYKSRELRERDEMDFVQVWPLLSADARRWLREALETTSPHHRWIAGAAGLRAERGGSNATASVAINADVLVQGTV